MESSQVHIPNSNTKTAQVAPGLSRLLACCRQTEIDRMRLHHFLRLDDNKFAESCQQARCKYCKYFIISTGEDRSLRIESFAIINLRGVSTKNN